MSIPATRLTAFSIGRVTLASIVSETRWGKRR
jgi:hypothetical protein